MQFRNATTDDLAAIVSIYNSTIPGRKVTADLNPVTVDERRQWFQKHNSATRPLWIVEDAQSEIIGWVSFSDFYGRPAYSGTAEISIYLDEKQRGKGYGKEILEYALKKSPTLHIRTVLGFIFEQNENSIRLFTQLGFKEWAHLPDIAVLDGKACGLKIFGKKISEDENE